MRIGIDVGGTNTDGVLIDNSNNVISSFKTNTSDDVNTAVKLCIEKLINNIDKKNIDLIIIGTTHLINDLIQRKNLSKTGVVRLCGPSTRLLKPLSDWPKELINKNLFSAEKNIILDLLINNFTNYERYIVNWFM